MATTPDISTLVMRRNLMNQMPATTGQQNFQQQMQAAQASPAVQQPKMPALDQSSNVPSSPQEGMLGKAFLSGLTGGAFSGSKQQPSQQGGITSAAQNSGMGLGKRIAGAFNSGPSAGSTVPDLAPSQMPPMINSSPTQGVMQGNAGPVNALQIGPDGQLITGPIPLSMTGQYTPNL